MRAFRSTAAVLALLVVLAPTAVLAQADGWRQVWADEFDGDRLDETRWTPATDCGGGGNEERQCYAASPETISVKDGVLRLTVVKRKTKGLANPWAGPTGPMKTGDYASGKILTQGKANWLYGRIEARARVPGGQGVWPAIWMMPELSTYGGWPRSGEIDILETVNLGAPCEPVDGACEGGRENRVFGTIHFAGDGAGARRRAGGNTVMPPSADGFHVYAVEWTPEAIAWFVDGQEYARVTPQDWKRDDAEAGPSPFDRPFHLILNLAFGGNWPESVNAKGVDEAALPATMEVDWVRVSQR
ncbi:glycoside hydrolase family 16 protein [Caulobacter segnis]|uniref:glycoside hydrolase family 16 protein n=1 Tax=Caulobacter segnis TaxID=88688 RepID=UPI00285E4326|nr:glycoside hydrolase family 16 protein [Caulobacter segnis]MDR6627780.1 beta-glucanase (GH16 family) [Caulobacter segnis]